MFISHYRLRMHDTDMAQIIFFARLFRIAHVAWEKILEKEGLTYQDLFTKLPFAIVIVHAEADYRLPLTVGDRVEIHTSVIRIGNASFSVYNAFYLPEKRLAANVTLVFATVNTAKRCTIPIPEEFLKILKRYD